MSPQHPSTNMATRIAAGIAAMVLLTLGGVYSLTYEPAPAIAVQWREGTSWPRRTELERRFGLVRPGDQHERVVTYDLVDIRSSNIDALLGQREIELISNLDLSTRTVRPDAPYGRGWMWSGTRVSLLRSRGAVPGLIIICVLLIGVALAKEIRARPGGLLTLATSIRARAPGVARGAAAIVGILTTTASQMASRRRQRSRAGQAATLAAALGLTALGAACYATYERAPAVTIAWRNDVSPGRRVELARRFRLVEPRPRDEGLRPTIYDLQDIRPQNVAALIARPEVEETGSIDRQRMTVRADAPLGRGGMWIGTRLPILRLYGVVPALTGLCLIVLAYRPISALQAGGRRSPTDTEITFQASTAPWLSGLTALIPAALVLALIAAVFGAGPRQFLPIGSDEVVNWNEAAAFAEAGFGGGYMVVQEEPARASFSRFGPHGPVLAAFHGTVAWAFGWRPYSAFLVNIAVVSLAAFAWIRATPRGTSPAALLVLSTFWPLLLYLPTNTEEPTHFAIAFLVALAIDRSLRGGAGVKMSTAALLLVAALLRPSWILMMLPLGWRRARQGGRRSIAALLILTIGAAAASWTAYEYLAAPSPQNTRIPAPATLETPGGAPAPPTETASPDVRQHAARTEEAPQIVLRYFTALLVAVLAFGCITGRRRMSADVSTGSPAPAEVDAAAPPRMNIVTLETVLLTVAPILVLVVAAGEIESWRDFHGLAPHLLVGLLVLAAKARREAWLWTATLALLPVYYDGFVAFHRERFTTDPRPIAVMREETAATIPFVPGAPPWMNTVTVHADLLRFPLLGLPRGIGASHVFDWADLMTPVRSRYLLLRPSDEQQLSSKVRLAPIGSTPLGTLYRNDGPLP